MDRNINHDYVTKYLRALLPKREGLLREIEEKSAEEDTYVSIAEPETEQLLRVLIHISNAKSVLEIGTGSAYSAISMAMEGCSVTTIERYEKNFNISLQNIEKSKIKRIKPLFGEASDILPKLSETFDMIFLDAAKGQYLNFLPSLLRLLNEGGILVSDNVLYNGMTAMEGIAVRRKVTIIKRLRKYLEEISKNPYLLTTVLPIGDGVAISYKRKEELKNA
ncbi:MAG: O-methyltransferase [Clostridia bacterium]|nr:O-methyltransferase [Clostridia bacterium]